MLKWLNPWVLLAFILALAGATGYGIHLGKSLEQAKMAEQLSLREQIQQTLAEEVSKIKVTNTTIRGKVETITRENTIYRDCKHSPDTLGLLNDILAGKVSKPAGDSVVPATDATP